MSADEFLAWEAGQATKHEFVDGEVFPMFPEVVAMAGAGRRHVTANGNVYMALRQHLRGSPCRTFMSDMKLRVGEDFFCPDVFVACGVADASNEFFETEAKLVVEVLSDSTAAYDRGAKFASYRRLPTLEEYLLVDIAARRSDLFRKGADGLWVLHPFAEGETLRLESVALDLPAEQVFAEIDGASTR